MTTQPTAVGGGNRPPGRHAPGRRGVVLLEVVLSLALFAMAAMIVLAGLNTALRAIQRVQAEADASDLAVTLLSEVQMGQVPLVSDGPNPYEDEALADWTWEIATEDVAQPLDVELPGVKRVEVIIRKTGTPFVYRLSELVGEEPPGGQQTPATADGQEGAGYDQADSGAGAAMDGGGAAADGGGSSTSPGGNSGSPTDQGRRSSR